MLEIQTRKVLGFSTALLLAVWIVALSSISGRNSYIAQLAQGTKPKDIVTLYDGLSILVPFSMAAAWIVTAKWMSLLYDESSERSPGSIRLTRKWAWWSWLAPVVTLWYPFMIIKDLLTERAIDIRSGGIRAGLWWSTWLGFTLLNSAIQMYSRETGASSIPIHPNLEIASACMLTASYQVWRQIVFAMGIRRTS